MSTSVSFNSVMDQQIVDGGSLGTIRSVLVQKGKPSLQMVNVSYEMNFAIVSALQRQISSGLKRLELNAVNREQFQAQIIHAEKQVSMRMAQMTILRQMGLPKETNLALLDAKQKHIFCIQLQSNLLFLSTILAKPARPEFIRSAGNMIADIESKLLQFSIGGQSYNPPPWLPLTNILDDLCCKLGLAEKETNDNTTTYTYPNGTKKVVDANGKATWFDKDGNEITSFEKDGSFWDLFKSVSVFEDSYQAEIATISAILGVLTGGLTLMAGLGLAIALYDLGDKYMSTPEFQLFTNHYFGGGMENFLSFEMRRFSGYNLHMNNNGAWQLFDPQKVVVNKGFCGSFDNWAMRMMVLNLVMTVTREMEWIRKDGSRMVIDAARKVTAYDAKGKPILMK